MSKRFMLLIICWITMMSATMAQAQVKVSGIVLGADDGEPIVGASVIVKGSKVGAATDVNGNFTLKAPSYNVTLVVSYIGMATKEVKASNFVKVTLQSNTQTLNEVVVTGYGVTKKAAFTGAANTIGEKQIGNRNDANPIKSLEGVVPGLQMNIGSGQPGAPASIFIRGINSINSGTQPLYVIDGVPFDNDAVGIRADEGQETSPLSTLNSSDIASITVLKDATATSIYGARAANGVIVITTKRGQAGKPVINVTAKMGFDELPSYTNRYKLVGTAKNIELATESLLNDCADNGDFSYMGSAGYANTAAAAKQFYDNYTGGWVTAAEKYGYNTDWMKEITRKGLTQSYGFDISGGGANGTAPVYYASFGYDNQKSLMKGKDLKRYSFRYNMDQAPSKFVKYGFNTNLSYTETNMGSGGGYYNDPLTQVYMMNPMNPVYNQDGSWNFSTPTGYNPVALRSADGDKAFAKQYRVLISPYLQINFTPDLFFMSRFGVDAYLIDEFGYMSFLDPEGANYNGHGENGNTTRTLLTTTNTLNYIHTFNNVHHLNLLVGQEGQKRHLKTAYLEGTNYPVEDKNDVALAAVPSSVSTLNSDLKLSSFFGNAQYDYDNKYYLSGSYRFDGSSRFAAGHRWSAFWSVGAKYRISSEKFMESTKDWLSNLSFRASYGTTGNQEVGTGWYAASDLFDYGYNYNGVPGSAHSQFGNSNLKWEETDKFNVGLDMTLFDRINITFDYYDHQTKHMVFAVPLSFTTGLGSIYQNVGKLSNKGVELTVNAVILKAKDLSWDVTFNGSYNKNKVVKLSTDNPIEGRVQITEVGHPLNQFKMKEWAGVDPKTGDGLWYLNETGSETTNNYNKAAKRYLGSANPKFIGSFSTNFAWKGFDLALQMNYSLGGKIYGSNLRYDEQTGASFYNNYTNYVYDHRWKQVGDITNVPRLTAAGSTADNHSSRFLMDGDYLKVRSLSIGYTLPSSLLEGTFINKVRLFMDAENLYTFTAKNYRGFDPAGIGSDGVQWWNYPIARSFMFGVNVRF